MNKVFTEDQRNLMIWCLEQMWLDFNPQEEQDAHNIEVWDGETEQIGIWGDGAINTRGEVTKCSRVRRIRGSGFREGWLQEDQ